MCVAYKAVLTFTKFNSTPISWWMFKQIIEQWFLGVQLTAIDAINEREEAGGMGWLGGAALTITW